MWQSGDRGKKFDEGKLRYDLIDYQALEGMVKVLTFGATKYGDNNWRAVENWRRRYYSAAMRHLVAWYRGEVTDPETGLPHMAHVATNIHFLASKEIEENGETGDEVGHVGKGTTND